MRAGVINIQQFELRCREWLQVRLDGIPNHLHPPRELAGPVQQVSLVQQVSSQQAKDGKGHPKGSSPLTSQMLIRQSTVALRTSVSGER